MVGGENLVGGDSGQEPLELRDGSVQRDGWAEGGDNALRTRLLEGGVQPLEVTL